MRRGWIALAVALAVAGGGLVVATAQTPTLTQRAAQPRRVRLILKDGTFQWVLGYQIVGKVVRYRSAERDGEQEEVPLALVDLPATEAWVRSQGVSAEDEQRTVLSPELAAEEAQRAARTPEILPGLRLPEEDSVVVLDRYHDTPELVPMQQEGSDLNHETAHDVRKQEINPASAAHDLLDMEGSAADVQVHTMQPVLYVRVGTDDGGDSGGAAITVDTHGASGRATPAGGAATSGYVLEKLSTRNDSRVVDSFRIAWLGERPQTDVVELKQEMLPGGKWMKLTPMQPLETGEYALVEVLSADAVNLDVWDFGVHPDAKEDVEAIRPMADKPAGLERR